MAIHPNALGGPAPSVDVAAWTAQAARALNAVSIASPAGIRGTSVSLAIDPSEQKERKAEAADSSIYRPRRKILRRDSLERREALLKGKEGSRRRTRWENDRLLNNPWAQPPLPSDWEVHPTYPRHSVPYYLAPSWEQEMAARAEATRQKQLAGRKQKEAQQGKDGEVPRELREKLKKAKAAKGLLKDLEEQVRLFVEGYNGQTGGVFSRPRKGILDPDSSDEEIVFVGRSGKMRDVPASPKFGDGDDSTSEHEPELEEAIAKDKLVFDGLVQDRGASFGRWLVHNIATYYGLSTWSRTIGDPARREVSLFSMIELYGVRSILLFKSFARSLGHDADDWSTQAYVGIPPVSTKFKGRSLFKDVPLPRPLWCMV
ncbi:uncharacterized protein KY384_003168 [Bacidia gigantensis]|uniref:uncharacterized protein n=1 Tax=Bacidia gigantensis TaxID=2732470 RepID=UPI001D055D30|nr:uncharacterized protein KY384_003168 [Bacidia gigantensis]KAG8531539.1 hypothetical protein KY384_003168 [Bacidia gigantensis]